MQTGQTLIKSSGSGARMLGAPDCWSTGPTVIEDTSCMHHFLVAVEQLA